MVIALLGMAMWPRPAAAAAKTWDGGGADNNWSTANNWSGNAVPVYGDTITFDSTSTKNCTMDINVTVGSITIASTYSGTISPSANPRSVVVTGNFTQSAGTFTAPARFTVGGTFSATAGTFNQSTGLTILTPAAAGTLTHAYGNSAAVTFNQILVLDAAGPSTTELEGYWKLDDLWSSTDSTTTAQNLSGYPSTGPMSSWPSVVTATGTTTMFSNNTYLHLDAATDGEYLYYYGGANGLTDEGLAPADGNWTISAWTRPSALDTGVGGCTSGSSDIVSSGFQGTSTTDYALRLCNTGSGTFLRATMRRSTGGNADCDSSNTFTVNDGAWHHAAATNNGDNLTVFLDGTKTVCSAYSGEQTYGQAYIYVGSEPITSDSFLVGDIDELRFYTRVLTDQEIMLLYAGTAGVSGAVTHNGSGQLTVTGAFNQRGGTFSVGAGQLTVGGAAALISGAFTIGSGTNTFNGGFNVGSGTTLTMNTTGGTLRTANGQTLTIDGTLDASSAGLTRTIRNAGSGNYTFTVGSSATATPTLNIDGLTVQNTDTNGMNINTVSGSSTTFTSFKNIGFSSGTGNYLLQIAASTLSLTATGLTFDASTTSNNVKLTDRSAGGSDVRLTLAATCAAPASNCETDDADDDTGDDNVADDAGNDGAIIQWLDQYHADPGGSVEGFPTVAFDWDTFAYHATYVIFNDASGTTDVLYKRTTTGAAQASYSNGTTNFVGSPRFIEVGNVFYVFTVDTAGNVRKLRDDGASFTQVATYRDGASATATSPLILDRTNVYWMGNNSAGNPRLISVSQVDTTPADGTLDANGSAVVVAGASVPSLYTVSGSSYLFFATNGAFYKLPASPVAAGSSVATPTSAVSGRISIISGNAFFVQDTGTLWAIDTATLGTSWSYRDTANHGASCNVGDPCTTKNVTVNGFQGRVYFGDKDGHVYAVYNSAGTTGAVIASNYPFRPGSASDVFETAPMYRFGVIAIGSTGGKLYFIDQLDNSDQPALIRAFELGSAVSSISWDFDGNQYMVGTANGRLYYLGEIADPTPGHI